MPKIKFFDEHNDSISVEVDGGGNTVNIYMELQYDSDFPVCLDIPTAIQFSKELRKAIAVAKNPK